MKQAHMVVQRPTDTWAKVIGEPKVLSSVTPPTGKGCPRGDSTSLEQCQVDVENDYLIGRKGIAIFVRCPNCGWQSEMMARSL